MTFQAVPNVAHIRVEGVQDQQLTIQDLYFEVSGGGVTSINLSTITEAVKTWAVSSLAPQLSRDWSFQRAVGVDLTAANSFVHVASQVEVGGVDVEAAPNNVAACVSLRTGFAGRSFRGRNYVCGIPNDEITLNTLSGPFISNLLTVYNVLPGAGTFEAGWQLGVVSRIANAVARPVGIITPVENVIMVGNSVRSMRSREIGHGA